MNKGVIYGVSGLPWLEETLVSAHSLRSVMPELPRSLTIDKTTLDLVSHTLDLKNYFTDIQVIDSVFHWRSMKFLAIKSSPYQQTLFLDGDTLIIDRLDELFTLLDWFDIAAAEEKQKALKRYEDAPIIPLFDPVPITFPELNTGVMVFNNTPAIQEMFDKWIALYERGLVEVEFIHDQGAFRNAIYYSDLRFAYLSPEYNLRAAVSHVLRGRVKIIHAHGHLKQIAQLANIKQDSIRMWKPMQGLTFGFNPEKVKDPHNISDSENKMFLDSISKTIERFSR